MTASSGSHAFHADPTPSAQIGLGRPLSPQARTAATSARNVRRSCRPPALVSPTRPQPRLSPSDESPHWSGRHHRPPCAWSRYPPTPTTTVLPEEPVIVSDAELVPPDLDGVVHTRNRFHHQGPYPSDDSTSSSPGSAPTCGWVAIWTPRASPTPSTSSKA